MNGHVLPPRAGYPPPDTTRSTGAGPVLGVENLTVSFRRGGRWREVVRDVSFDIGRGETVALVGESGSGKSVTALAVMRLLGTSGAAVSGRIQLDGTDINALPERAMRRIRGNRIGMIFQEPMTSLNPVRSIGFQIAEALVLHRGLGWSAAYAETARLLDRVRISDARARLREYPHAFSGGMRQRVMIAMALACRPDLLIADEPTTALDVTIQAQILELIRELQEAERMSVLFITHDIGVVETIADRIVVMSAGRAIEQGQTRMVLTSPVHVYTRSLLAAVPRLGEMSGVDGPRRYPVIDPETGQAQPGSAPGNPVPAQAAPVLEVSGLTVTYNSGRGRGVVRAARNVSFSIRPGETLALVGESGSGKSTVGRAVVRLLDSAGGRILIGGEDILSAEGDRLHRLRRNVQIVFQDPFSSLDPRQRVGASILSPLQAHGLIGKAGEQERCGELLRRVGLSPDMADRLPHEFSGGQRQRICIARALSLAPGLIVADEAVSALDASVKAQILNLLLDLQAEHGIAYLFISHDMGVVERFSHRVAVMYRGEIVEIGPRAAIFDEPQHPYTQSLLASVPGTHAWSRFAGARHGDASDPPTPSDRTRDPGYEPAERQYRQVSDGHFVMMPETSV